MSNQQFKPPFSLAQQQFVAFMPRIPATLSFLGALYIVQDVVRMPRTTSYHRMLLAMSLMDLIFAVKSFASTWPLPEDTPYAWGAMGTTATCEISGFLGHGASLTSALYNGSLSLYFFLSLVLMYREEAVRQVEWILHLVPFGVAWGTAVVGLPLQLYNPIGWTCWIGSYPPGCGSETCPCERGGNNVDAYRWAFYHAELWCMFGVAGATMFAIYRTVQRRERAMESYGVRDSSAGQPTVQRQRLAKRVATQAILYQSFFFVTWIFPMLMFVVSYLTGNLYFPLLALTVVFTPLQGFFDAVIYVRPRFLKYRERLRRSAADEAERHHQATWRRALRQALSMNPDNDFQGEVVLNPNDGDTEMSQLSEECCEQVDSLG